ncbi:MAG: FtsX-like permease family protein, partial [Myxococcota bacterium]
MRASLHSHKSLLNGLDSLLFPASIEVELFAWARVQDTLRKLSAELSKVQGVQEVDYGREWFAPLWRMASWVRWILSLGGGLLLLCISLIAAGTIRLSFLLHQQEIEVMRLMGATEDFIRAPFLLEGAFSGGVSALCATFVLGFVFWGIEMQYGEPFFRFTSTSMQFLSWWQCLLLLGGAVLAGFLGSWLALRNPSKFVQVGGNNVLQEVE